MKDRNALRKFGAKIGSKALPVATLAFLSVPAFAQEAGSYETGASLAWISAGIAAGIVILGAMMGLVTMIGAGKKAQRAGT